MASNTITTTMIINPIPAHTRLQQVGRMPRGCRTWGVMLIELGGTRSVVGVLASRSFDSASGGARLAVDGERVVEVWVGKLWERSL